jgi:epoxide hydrolase
MPAELQPFRIAISDAVLEDLRQRLARTRFPDQIPGSGWGYGTELGYLRELCAYWRDKFDWRAREAELNRFPQFTTEVLDHRIHFVHRRSPHADAFPIVITHGWPGSFAEFVRIIEPLADPSAHGGRAEDAFHVVCPSIPGYGFSEAPREPGWDARRMGEVNAALMARLGYGRYGAQGGDWGSMISTQNALLDPEHCVGLHLNMVVALPPSDVANPLEGLRPEEIRGVTDMMNFQKNETGYSSIQGTKPQTLGYGLNDSPAGLAAWIAEKFRAWSDCGGDAAKRFEPGDFGGDLESRFSKDELLTNITLYWATQTIASSTRLYCETMRSGLWGPLGARVEVPTGCAIFPKEIFRPPRAWAERVYHVTHWSEMPRGGHFAAMEEPELFVEDLRAFFRTVR